MYIHGVKCIGAGFQAVHSWRIIKNCNRFYIRYISRPPYFILKIMILKVDLYTGKYGMKSFLNRFYNPVQSYNKIVQDSKTHTFKRNVTL